MSPTRVFTNQITVGLSEIGEHEQLGVALKWLSAKTSPYLHLRASSGKSQAFKIEALFEHHEKLYAGLCYQPSFTDEDEEIPCIAIEVKSPVLLSTLDSATFTMIRSQLKLECEQPIDLNTVNSVFGELPPFESVEQLLYLADGG